MLSDCIRSIEMELINQHAIMRRFSKRMNSLSELKEMTLIAENQRGSTRYFLSKLVGGIRRRTYLNKYQQDLRRRIQERYYLERAIPMCRKNIEMLEMIRDSYYSLDPEEVVKDAPLAYREQENATRLVYGYDNETAWKRKKLTEKAKHKVPYPEGLKHVAGDGTPTRSLSEALIIDLLNSKGIPYVYEYPMRLGYKVKWPDFILWDKKHKREVLIEHLGMLNDDEYREDQTEKLGLYIQAGYVPNVNLLLTCNDKDGNLNVPAISKMIDAVMCVRE